MAQSIPTSGLKRPTWNEFRNFCDHQGTATYSALPPSDVRRLTTDLGPYEIKTGGGLLRVAPIELVQIAQVQASTIRQLATVISSNDWGRWIPTIDDMANEGLIINPAATPPDVIDPEFGRRSLVPWISASGPVNISRALLQDFLAFLANLIYVASQRKGRYENRAFTVGVPGGPKGIVNEATLGVTTAATGAIAIDEVLQLIGSIDAYYRPAAKLMMNTATWTTLAQLKSSLSGDYLWRLAGLDKFEIAFNNHMPNMTAGARPILFGDFSTYIISESGVVSVQIMLEQRVEFFETVLEVFQPIDGALADAAGNAVAALQMAAS
jgi:HK97 family phage major capsid protein